MKELDKGYYISNDSKYYFNVLNYWSILDKYIQSIADRIITQKIPQETRSMVLATSFNISIIHGRVSTDHAPYITKIYTEHSKQEGGGRVD